MLVLLFNVAPRAAIYKPKKPNTTVYCKSKSTSEETHLNLLYLVAFNAVCLLFPLYELVCENVYQNFYVSYGFDAGESELTNIHITKVCHGSREYSMETYCVEMIWPNAFIVKAY